MMRFTEGAMVEVFCQTENPVGSWRCAKIVRGDGHDFVVKYYCIIGKEWIEETVPRKFIRPSPSKVEFVENWRSGDVFEVLHNFTWKMATLSKVLSRGKFLVRLVGLVNEFEVGKSDIRLRQSWVDGKWIVIGKNVMNNVNKRSQRTSSKINLKQKPGHIVYEDNINLPSFSRPSTRMLKRKTPNYCSQTEACRQNSRENEKDANRYPVYFERVSRLPEKVKGNAFDRDVLDENILPLFPNGRMRNVSDTNKTRKQGDGVGCSPSVRSGRHANDDAACSSSWTSVASNDPFNWRYTTDVHAVEIEKDYCSDVESSCWSKTEEMSSLSFTEEEMAAEIHRLELHAYRCTVKAFHASGPLTWEYESLMTNLRISLHISNDEHLMEIRTLISNSGNSPC